MHAAGDRAGEGGNSESFGTGGEGFDLPEIIGAHLDPGAASAQGGQRQLQNRRSGRRRGQAGDQAIDGAGERGYGIHPACAGGQHRVGSASLEVVDADVEAAAAQIDGKVPPKIPESDEAVAQIQSLKLSREPQVIPGASNYPKGRSIISKCKGLSST